MTQNKIKVNPWLSFMKIHTVQLLFILSNHTCHTFCLTHTCMHAHAHTHTHTLNVQETIINNVSAECCSVPCNRSCQHTYILMLRETMSLQFGEHQLAIHRHLKRSCQSTKHELKLKKKRCTQRNGNHHRISQHI